MIALPKYLWAIVTALVLAVSGCAQMAHYQVNDALKEYQPEQGYRFQPAVSGRNTNSLFVCLTFSGGGTRAAALSYGVLEKLRDVKIKWKGQEKSLLDEVDCISSVSGGSFTAAYYGLYGDRIFQDFRHDFLERDIQGDIIARALNPANWVRLASPYYSRIDLAAEVYDDALFSGSTFADLMRRNRRPFLMINATNMANGDGFEFTQDQFDFLGSDLSTYPIARAVAASSAFPFLLSPISLKNYPDPKGYHLPKDAENAAQDFNVNRRRYEWARNRVRYRDYAQRPFVHLMDGGLADNIGLRAIEDSYLRSSGFIRHLINEGEIEKLVIIVVNARTQDQDNLSREESPAGLTTVAYKTATVALDNYSFETIEFMKDLRTERKQAQMVVAACQKKLDACPGAPRLPTFAKSIDPYVIEVDFEAIPDKDRRAYFLGLPTSFSLNHEQVSKLIEIGPELLDAAPEYRELMQSLGPR